MNINEIIKDVEVIDYTYTGMGVVKVEEYPLFVPNVIKGEIVDIKVKSLDERYGFGELYTVNRRNSNRVEPKCPLFKKCGGCNLLHMNYQEQVNFKKNYLNDLLKRNGIERKVDKFLSSSEEYFYRNKMSFKLKMLDGQLVFGMNYDKSHDFVKVHDCYLQDDEMNFLVQRIVEILNNRMSEQELKNLTQLIIRKTKMNEVMIIIVGREKIKVDIGLMNGICENFANLKSLQVAEESKSKFKQFDNPHLVYGKDYILEQINGNHFRIQGDSFLQVNTNQTEKLYSEAVGMISADKNGLVLDAFCGIGTIGIDMSRKVGSVIGVDVNARAIEDARKNADLNNIKNINFLSSSIDNVLMYLRDLEITSVLVDPPRSGISRKFKDFIIEQGYKEMVYISCNPATLMRDLKDLGEYYNIERIVAVDMFVQTMHVETVTLLHRKNDY